MPSKSETPTSVRVARWTALAATITALGTVGNTFIEKRPWFLGGDNEPPAQVLTVTPHPVANYSAPYTPPSTTKEPSTAPQTASAPDYAQIQNVTMAEAIPDVSTYENIMRFNARRPISSMVIFGSLAIILIYSLVEYIHKRKPKDKT